MCKRAFDIAIALPAAICSLPIIIPLSLVMAFNTKSNPIFTQRRLGKDKVPFTVYKIKTMRDECDSRGIYLSDDKRTSKLGVVLRKTRLDELPQFFNILKGDMSVVGARPSVDVLIQSDQRYSMRPGLTGLAQINRLKVNSEEDKLNYDLAYIEMYNGKRYCWNRLLFDAHIVLKTPLSLFKTWSIPHSRKLMLRK